MGEGKTAVEKQKKSNAVEEIKQSLRTNSIRN